MKAHDGGSDPKNAFCAYIACTDEYYYKQLMKKDLNYWIDLWNTRGNASSFARSDPDDKKQVELHVANMFALALSTKFEVRLADVTNNPYEPPDIVAKLNHSVIGIETTELIDGQFLAKAKFEAQQGRALNPTTADGFSLTQWPKDRFLAHLKNRIQKKAKKYDNQKIDVLLIYSGEYWLNEQNVSQYIEASNIDLPACFKAVFLILDYEPSCEHKYPLFLLAGNLY